MKLLVKRVKALNNFELEVIFTNGYIKTYNMNPIIKEMPEIFGIFYNKSEFFKNVKTRDSGVYWNDEIDLAAEELWNNGYLIGHESSIKGELSLGEIDENNFQEVNIRFKFPKDRFYEYNLLEGDIEIIFNGEKFSF